MLDPALLREHPELLRDTLRRRGSADLSAATGQFEQVDQDWRAAIHAVEQLKARRNAVSDAVKRAKQAGESAEDSIRLGREIGQQIAELEKTAASLESERDALLYQLPNILLPDVPSGGEDQNREIRAWGTPRSSDGVKPHWEIGEALGIIDLARGAKISGSGFVVFRGAGARLVRALMSWMLALHTGKHGYEEVWVPFLVSRQTMTGTGQLPKFEDDLYKVPDEDLFLIPTAEVPVTNLLRDEIIDAARLPLALTAYSPCFRREAGSYGKDTRGLLRVHQFDKVELVRFSAPEDSAAQHQLLLEHAEAVLQELGLPYRVVLLAGGDTGVASAKTYDLEVWAPGVGKWLEVSSCSTFTDYQARRANIRYRPDGGGKPRFVHTLNGSGLAFPRTIAAILEHYQRPDGTVEVPSVLRPFMGDTERIG
ncbi:MAG TPA: serine--tRNA ligase [Gemmatimonadaceae bacterium]|nr:serine--tRNA ligase [Gemmatimonadaceae bacterium]